MKRRSAPPYVPYGSGRTLRYVLRQYTYRVCRQATVRVNSWVLSVLTRMGVDVCGWCTVGAVGGAAGVTQPSQTRSLLSLQRSQVASDVVSGK